MAIEGKKKEQVDFSLKCGLVEVKVIAINPLVEDYKEILGIDLPEESKATEYIGESKEGNTYLRVDVWVEGVSVKFRDKVSFYLEDKIRENKDGSKTQYIDTVGNCSWADDPNNLPQWFLEREHREAHSGEEDLFNFLHKWLGAFDTRDKEGTLSVAWKPLMKGNVKEIREFMGCEYETTFGVMAEVKTVEKDGEIKEYQSIYNKAFLPTYSLKYFRLVDYSNPDVQAKLSAKKSKDLKAHEKFVVGVVDPEYGSKNFYSFKDLHDYDPKENIAASDKSISSTGPDY
jgi:hypothetical protein